MIRLLATDFDGTVRTPNGRPQFPPDLLHWLRSAQARRVKWVVCTGRDLNRNFEGKLARLNGDPLPDFIVTVDREIRMRKGDWYKPDAPWNLQSATEHADLFARALDVVRRLRQWIRTRRMAKVYADRYSPLNVRAATLDEADQIHRRMIQEFRAVPDLTIVRNTQFFRLAHRRYTKGSAMGEIARRLGIRKDEILAAGDHHNDLTMLDGTFAGLVAAPSNAIPEVKAMVRRVGGYIAAQPCGMGVLEALRFFERK
ncbi:MAG: HAD family phosphatase [Verrucomicrobia bacterium]|nr:HAD family phosphatase [Verrucomicrobiota bacterium]